MDIDRERVVLQHCVEGHQKRVDYLRARIDRLTRELRLHETIRDLAANSQLPEAMRSLAEMTGVKSVTSSEVRNFLAERGVSVPTEFDIRVQGAGDDFSVLAIYRDVWFPVPTTRTSLKVRGELSWNSRESFQARIVDYSWREVQATSPTEEA